MTRPTRRVPPGLVLPLVLGLVAALPVRGGAQAPRSGLEFGGLPALNFDADEGFGYGAIAELYHYGDGGRTPYVWTLQPTVFLTTEGRRDLTLFFDAPHLLPGGWRIDLFLGTEAQIATPYYGMGNDARWDETRETDADPYYYRFGRARRSGAVNLQRPLGRLPLRLLLGAGVGRTEVTPVPEGEGTTLLAAELAGAPAPAGWTNHARAGLVWDTRDRETGPRRGTWTELLVQRADTRLGGDWSWTRLTFTDRRYWTAAPRLVLANRFLVQHTTEGAPLHELHRIQTSFKQQEGLGGGKSVRGLPKNRYVGRGLFLWNFEARFRAADFRMLGRPFHLVVSTFLDSGRVWAEGVRPGELFVDLHHGVGGGVRLGMGENFVVALDAGTSRETGMPFYIGLGYLF